MSPAATAVNMRVWVKWASSLQTHAENRVLNALLTGAFMFYLAEPIIYLLLVPGSPVWRVARLTPATWLVGMCFVLCLLALVPYMWLLLTSDTWIERLKCAYFETPPTPLDSAWPRRWAARGSVGAAIIWIVLAALAVPMDTNGLQWAFGMRALGAALMGGIYGVSLNAQQLRKYLDDLKDE